MCIEVLDCIWVCFVLGCANLMLVYAWVCSSALGCAWMCVLVCACVCLFVPSLHPPSSYHPEGGLIGQVVVAVADAAGVLLLLTE